MQKLKICQLDLNQKTLLIRADLNVPLKPDGTILSTERIQASLPTIIFALKQNCKILLLSHLGRVKSEQDKNKFSLKQVGVEIQRQLQQVLDKKVVVKFCPQTRGPALKEEVKKLEFGEILLLENTRFEDLNQKAESKNNQELAKEWATLAEIFVNDAFGTLHRTHASNYGIAKFSKTSCLGLLVEHEIRQLSQLLENPKKPFVGIVGGAKVVDKIGILKNLLKKVDKLLIGGGMAYTFMKVLGKEVGHSLVDKNALEEAKLIIEEYKDKIVLPIDFTCATGTDAKEFTIYDSIPPHLESLDIGPKTVEVFKKHILGAKTVFWNGPLGFYENPLFAKATKEVAKTLAQNPDAFTVVGGGDSAAAASEFKEKISHISTGGGAALEFLEGKVFDSLEIITNQSDFSKLDCQKEWYNLGSFVDKNLKNSLKTEENMKEESKKPDTAPKAPTPENTAVKNPVNNPATAAPKPAAEKVVTPTPKVEEKVAPKVATENETLVPPRGPKSTPTKVETITPDVFANLKAAPKPAAEKVVTPTPKVVEKVATPTPKPTPAATPKPAAAPKVEEPKKEVAKPAETPKVAEKPAAPKPLKETKTAKAKATKTTKTTKTKKVAKATKTTKTTKAAKPAVAPKVEEKVATPTPKPTQTATPKPAPQPKEAPKKRSFFAALFSFFKKK